ncbi:hypothetical protein FE257_000466 [Aspergillus nanangensis]|uniref:HD domain-containing protein n=1 Tax=Aspergillus nanangensis TaxID=2582783 RepID=A0AAD4CW95_ASPNN|nr:hypothetical protein FE257_000466 [Aspergillus nanangensis]
MLSATDHAREIIQQLFAFILAQGNTDYLGERVSQLEHSLQCGYLAQQSTAHGNDPEVILGALLHDVGRFIPDAKDMPEMIAPDGAYIGRASHEVLGERYLRQLGFGEKVCQLVGSHVMAKSQEQIDEARKDPWLEAKLAVRRWDDKAKVPNMEVPNLASYEDLAIEYLASSRSRIWVDSRSYSVPTNPTLVISIPDNIFDKTLSSRALVEIKESKGWITQRVRRRSTNGTLSIEDNALDQLTRRGVRVVAVSSGKSTTSSKAAGIIRFSAEDGSGSSLPEGVENLHDWLGLQLPSHDSAGSLKFAVQAGTKLLQKGLADLVLLDISDEPSVDSLVEELTQVNDLSPDTVVAITTESPDSQRGDDDIRQTIFEILPSE